MALRNAKKVVSETSSGKPKEPLLSEFTSELSSLVSTAPEWAQVVWFEYGKNSDLIDDEYIRTHFKQAKEWQFKDGSIFYFTHTNFQ